MDAPLLEFRDIGKSYFGVPVLMGIDLAVGRGRALGLVGENGAGKSTLMNILGGVVPPDTGAMFLDGRPYAPSDPADATRRGIAFIHQELNLFPNLSIAENLELPGFPSRIGRGVPLIRRSAMRAEARRALEAVGLDRRPETPVEELAPGERQLVEIAKALTTDAGLILFDEPTTSLSNQEAARLFDLIETLKKQNITIIYISHALNDVLRLCEDVAVLRDGELVETGPTASFTLDGLITRMVGRDLGQLFPERSAPPSEERVLEVVGVSEPGVLEGISFELRRGEVLGLSGLMGSGRTELARILFGLDPFESGSIRLEGKPLRRSSPRARVRRGMAFLTENRREEGLMMEASVLENIVLAALPNFAKAGTGLFDHRKAEAAVMAVAGSVKLREADLQRPAKGLSGGNQQKVVLAKWILAKPSVLILDEPTRGVDVSAKREIYGLIDRLAAQGSGVLLISSEIEELIGLCDRILVLSRGELRGSFHRGELDREAILRAALPGEGGR